MTYECKTCHWMDEVKKMPTRCGRCLAVARFLRKLSDDEEFNAQDQHDLTWCNACKRFHSR